ncbi:MAG: hypothetical protein RR951_04945, partial [Ruthenibacterium sp.]
KAGHVLLPLFFAKKDRRNQRKIPFAFLFYLYYSRIALFPVQMQEEVLRFRALRKRNKILP